MTARRLILRGRRVNSFVRDVIGAHVDHRRSRWPLDLDRGSPAAFAFAAACLALATAVHSAFGLVRPEAVVFAPYYAATLIAALVGGAAAGFLAMVLGGVI